MADPGNSLKVLVYELRKRFDMAVPGLGKQIIKYKFGSYYLSGKDVLFECDAELFEREAILSLAANEINSIKLARRRYTGAVQITDRCSTWQNMLQEKYHNYYKRLVLAEIDILLHEDNYDEAVNTCTEACLLFPTEKTFCDKYREMESIVL